MRSAIALIGVWIAACGDDGARQPDAMSDATVDSADAQPDRPGFELAIEPPAEPMMPALPRIAPCPEGWMPSTTPGGAPTCDPWSGSRRVCTGATMQLPGSSECTPVGTACPADRFPSDLPTDRAIVYVDGSAPTIGAGTRDLPYQYLDRGISAAGPGGFVAVAPGRYDLYQRVPFDLDIVGACPSETILVGPTAARDPDDEFERPAVFVLPYPNATLRLSNVTLTGTMGFGIVVSTNARLVLEHVVVDGPFLEGILVYGVSHATLRDVAFRGMAGDNAAGIECALASVCSLERVAFTDFAGRAVIIDSEAEVTMQRVAIARVEPLMGTTVVWSRDSSLTATDLAISDVVGGVFSSGGTLEIDHYAIREATSYGALVFDTTGAIRHATFEGTRGSALSAGEGADLDFEDTVIVDTRGEGSEAAFGISAGRRSDLRIRRTFIERSEGVGIVGPQAPPFLVEDAVVKDTMLTSSGEAASGVILVHGELSRVLVDGAQTGVVGFMGGEIRLVDVTLRNVIAPMSTSGIALAVADGAHVDLARVLVEQTSGLGIGATGAGVTVTGTDVIVRDAAELAGQPYGRAIEASDTAAIDLRRVHVHDVRDFAVAAGLAGAVRLEHVRIEDVAPQLCADTTCSDAPAGFAIGAQDARIELREFELERAALCGVGIATGADITLARGRIAQMPVAVCVDDPAFDLASLEDEVFYEQNGATVESRTLTVPSIALPMF